MLAEAAALAELQSQSAETLSLLAREKVPPYTLHPKP